jgi:hypothetical protein
MIGKCSSTELHPQPHLYIIIELVDFLLIIIRVLYIF